MHISTTWINIAFLVMAIALAIYSHRKPDVVAPFKAIFDQARSHPITHVALVVIWLWLGWHFFLSPHML
jgi:hypothetical protein